jgi:heptosyltransferase-2
MWEELARMRRLVNGMLVSGQGQVNENLRGRVINVASKQRSAPLVSGKLDGLLGGRKPKICIYRRLGGMGDVIMTTPIMKHIKRLLPNSHIVYATDLKYANGGLADIIRYNPYVDEIADFASINPSKFDLFTDVTATGLDRERSGKVPHNRIDMFAQQVGLDISSDPLPDYFITEDEREWAKKELTEFLGEIPRKEAIVIGIQIRSNDERRTWPLHYMEELINMLAKDSKARIMAFDWSADKQWESQQVKKCEYGLRYTAALIEQCDVVVCPDSAILHLAGALQKKIIAIFGPVPPESRINYYANATAVVAGLPCQYCWYSPTCGNKQQCLHGIKPRAVFEAIRTKLADKNKVQSVVHTNTGRTGIKTDNVILVKRHHGGLGDIIMTLPGIEALKRKYPSKQIHYAIPIEYHAAIRDNPFIDQVIDINGGINNNRYAIIMDISSPCARYESERIRMGKTVDKSRIELFAEALGTRNFLKPEELRPSLYISEENKEFSRKFIEKATEGNNKKLIGIAMYAAEEYRDWPKNNFIELIENIKNKCNVVLFHSSRIDALEGIIDACGFPIDKAIAILSNCDGFISADTGLLHVAGAFNIPSIALFGPIDCNARCKNYDNVTVIRANMPCIPCWRNRTMRCTETGKVRGYSKCMESILPRQVLKIADKKFGSQVVS